MRSTLRKLEVGHLWFPVYTHTGACEMVGLSEVIFIVALILIPVLVNRLASGRTRTKLRKDEHIWPPDGCTANTRADRKTGYIRE